MNLSETFSSLQQEVVGSVEGIHPSTHPSIRLSLRRLCRACGSGVVDPARQRGQRGRCWPFRSGCSPAWKVLSRSRLPMNCKSSGCHRNSQGATQPSGSITVIFSILFALHQSTLNSLWHWCSAERFPPRSYSCAVSKPQ